MAIFHRAVSRNNRQTRRIELRDAFGNMDLLKERNMFDDLLRGLVTERAEKADNNFVDDVRL